MPTGFGTGGMEEDPFADLALLANSKENLASEMMKPTAVAWLPSWGTQQSPWRLSSL